MPPVKKERKLNTMRINNNITALNSHRQYGINTNNIAKNVEKLSSGYRVNRAGDDAAGLAISEKMRSQIRGLNMASKNSQDAVSLVQTAEGGLQTVQNILQRMRELSVQAASDTNTLEDRVQLQREVNQLVDEINQIVRTTQFNTMTLLSGRFGSAHKDVGDGTGPGQLVIQAGANQSEELIIKIENMDAGTLGVGRKLDEEDTVKTGTKGVWLASLDEALDEIKTKGSNIEDVGVLTQKSASNAIKMADVALQSVSNMRAELGAYQNRLEFKIHNLDNQAENLSASESRIRDADMAKMMTEFTKNSILFQASTAMLAQANALPQGVLQLLG